MSSWKGRAHHLAIAGAVLCVVLLAGVIAATSLAQRSIRPLTGSFSPLTRSDPALASSPTPVDAARFAAGACISEPPTAGDKGHTVFLDAGHGGRDPGSVGQTSSGRTIEEANETLPVELDAAARLRARGFRVIVSRTRSGSGAVARLSPHDIDGRELSLAGVHADVAARALCADSAHAQVLVGIYFDAGVADNAGSVTGYDPDRPFAADNRVLANLLQRDTLAVMNAHGWRIPSESVQNDAGLGSAVGSAAAAYPHLLELGPAKPGYFATPSQMPGAIIEPLFITDPFEATLADASTGQQVIASGIAEGVERYFVAVGPAARGG